MIALRADDLKIERVLWSEKIYLVPRNDGRILAGATVEYTGFEKGLTAGGLEKILAGAIELSPGLADARVEETWAGFGPTRRIICQSSDLPTSTGCLSRPDIFEVEFC